MLTLLHPGCWSLRSGCALSFLGLLPLGPGGSPNVWVLKGRVLCPRGCLRLCCGGNGSMGTLWPCSPCGVDLSREVLKGSVVPGDKVLFQDCPMEFCQPPALGSCWSPGLHRPLLLRQFKCFGCRTIFRIASGYSFIPFD